MTLPEQIETETDLEDALAEPSDADLDCVTRLDGDVLVLGAGGKMGPSLARRVHRAIVRSGIRRRVVAASRFSSPAVRKGLEAEGIQTFACDLLEPARNNTNGHAGSAAMLAGSSRSHANV